MSIKATCPDCGHPFIRPDGMAGLLEKCPRCRKVMRLPKPPSPTVQPAVEANAWYHSPAWNVSLQYPAGWEVVAQNRPAGAWITAVAIAGPEAAGARPGLMVNVARPETPGAPASSSPIPRAPQECLQAAQQPLPGVQLVAAEETRMMDAPAARMIYACDSPTGRRIELCAVIFDPLATYQVIAEASETQFDACRGLFEAMLRSLRLGRPPTA